MPHDAAHLLKDARTRAGLSQRRLARRARTTQSVVARIELGDVSPSWATLTRLLAAAGFEPHTTLVARVTARSHMLDDVPRIRRLSPAARLAELRNASRLFAAVRRA